MAGKGFWGKLMSPTIWGNLLAMLVVAVLLAVGLWQGMAIYTHHGEGVDVPNVEGMLLSDAQYALGRVELIAVVADSSYNRSLPAGTVLEQMPGNGSRVKSGREVYLTVNAEQIPTLPVPDIADNCSLREAEAKVKALGFKLGPIEYAPGDKDWVLAVKSRGRQVFAGERVPIDVPIVLVVGNNEMEFGERESDEGHESWSDSNIDVATPTEEMSSDLLDE